MKKLNNHNMLKASKGRPAKTNNEITINELECQYLTTKENNYGKNIMYFKITDTHFRSKLKPLFSLNDGDLKMHIFTSDTGDHLLKVSEQWFGGLVELVSKSLYSVDLLFQFYELETSDKKTIKGYYSKIPDVKLTKPLPMVVEVTPQDDEN